MSVVRAGFALLAAVLLAGGLLAADDTKKAGQDNAPPPKARGTLPPNFKQLGLSPEQKEKIGEIRSTYSARIAELERKIRELRRQELAEAMAVLTDSQKARLREIAQEKATGESPRTSGNKNDNKKSP